MIRVMLVTLALSLVACGDDDAVSPPAMMSPDDFVGWWAFGDDEDIREGFELRDIPSLEEIGDVPRGVLIRWNNEDGCEDVTETKWYLVDATEHTAALIVLWPQVSFEWDPRVVLERIGNTLIVASFNVGGAVSHTLARSTDPCPD